MRYLKTNSLKKIAKKISMIALDMDDTTLRSDGTLSSNTESAIKEAISHGIEIVIASGRSYSSLPKDVINLEGIRYAITSNGAAIYDIQQNRRIYSLTLDSQSVMEILDLLHKENLCMEVFVDGVPHADARFVANPSKFGCASETAIQYIQSTRVPEKNIMAFIDQHINCLDSLDVRCTTLEARTQIEQMLQKNISNIYITSSLDSLLEIVNPNAGKGAGLRFLSRKLNILPSSITAFGNADNDIDMMEYAALGVAVQNATPHCLEAADIVTEDNDHEGVAQVIEESLHLQRFNDFGR